MQTVSENTIDRLVAKLLIIADSRGRIRSDVPAMACVEEIVGPLTHVDSGGWIDSPRHRESVRAYAKRMYRAALAAEARQRDDDARLVGMPTEELKTQVALWLRSAEQSEKSVPGFAKSLRQDARRFEAAIERRRVLGLHARRVYVCHPYRDAPAEIVERLTAICQALLASGHLPVAPQLCLPPYVDYVDEASKREKALAMCLEYLDASDEVRVYGQSITADMRLEIERAEARGIPVRFVDTETGGEPRRDDGTVACEH